MPTPHPLARLSRDPYARPLWPGVPGYWAYTWVPQGQATSVWVTGYYDKGRRLGGGYHAAQVVRALLSEYGAAVLVPGWRRCAHGAFTQSFRRITEGLFTRSASRSRQERSSSACTAATRGGRSEAPEFTRAPGARRSALGPSRQGPVVLYTSSAFTRLNQETTASRRIPRLRGRKKPRCGRERDHADTIEAFVNTNKPSIGALRLPPADAARVRPCPDEKSPIFRYGKREYFTSTRTGWSAT